MELYNIVEEKYLHSSYFEDIRYIYFTDDGKYLVCIDSGDRKIIISEGDTLVKVFNFGKNFGLLNELIYLVRGNHYIKQVVTKPFVSVVYDGKLKISVNGTLMLKK